MKSKPCELMMTFDSVFIDCNIYGEQTCFSVIDHHQFMETRYWWSTIHR